jgi:catechol 2,3-dioxygenase-like lactoylglutathione lyase family enzyme
VEVENENRCAENENENDVEEAMATVTVTQLHVLAIYVSDLAGARDFYKSHFGFEDAGEMPPGLLLQGGGATLYLEEGRAPRAMAEEPLPAEICPCFGLESIKAGWEALSAAGLHVLMPYTEFAPTFAMFAVADPDGNRLEFAGKP